MMSEDSSAAEALKNFTVSAFILGSLEDVLEERIDRLADELPTFLKEAASRGENDEEKVEGKVSHTKSRRRLSPDIPAWLQSGLNSSFE